MRAWLSAPAAVLAVVLGLAGASAQDEPFRRQLGEYTLLYSVVRADALPEQAARRHGLSADPNIALLTVAVRHRGRNVRAEVEASAVNLMRQEREIGMREAVANGMVSYVGSFEIADRDVLEFTVDVLPRGAERPLRLEFRESFLPPTREEALR